MAAKPSVLACRFGSPPDPAKIQPFPGVERSFLPHDALIVYTDKLMAERKAYQTPAGKQWFKDHKKHKAEQERLTEIYRMNRLNKAREAEEHRLRQSRSSSGLLLPSLH
eukprot:TRINITY_DN4784_c0_g3_i2.p1 TRINITY_DN4784_c0_g3~~TRINITY_DN4784_c0_g3_i2.p1  ORF type:complete len:123 (-),score=18.68 TRINITY_DN4784_c0_g3_i2:560-886(-)